VALIEKAFRPLDFAQVNPAKINLGLAYYGRTYKVQSASSCQIPGQCQYEGPGAPGQCTNSIGVLSNREIKAIAAGLNVVPTLNTTGMYKYFGGYGGGLSMVAYDDSESLGMKLGYANDRCLGGTMIWSIDFDAAEGAGF
jgi:chitinase